MPRVYRHLIWLNFFCTPMIYTPSSFAARVSYFDIDGTLFHDSGLNEEGKLPAFRSYYVLKRILHVNSGWTLSLFEKLKAEGKLPDEVLITPHEYDLLIRGRLATREERPGDPSPVQLLPDPIKNATHKFTGARPAEIYPGFYLLIPEIAYRYFDDEQSGMNSLLIAYEDAKARTAAAPDTYDWRGRALPYFRIALEKQDSQNIVRVITDRRPKLSNLLALFHKMFKNGDIPNPIHGRQHPGLISTTDASARAFGSIFDFSKRKPNILFQEASALARSPLPFHSTLSPDANQAKAGIYRHMHEVIFYENNPEYVSATVVRLRDMAARFPNIKFILNHAGKQDDVLGSDFNYPGKTGGLKSRWIIFMPTGKGWRFPEPGELSEITGTKCVHHLIKEEI